MTRTNEERLYDSALARCREAFKQGKLPVAVGDLYLAMESAELTSDELEYIESLVGDYVDIGIG